MRLTKRTQPLLTGGLTLLLALGASGCRMVKAGISAYYAGDYATAVRHLKKPAEKLAKSDPRVSVSLDSQTRVEDALPHATRQGFDIWQAYAGSLIGLGRMEEGCLAIQSALRPIRVEVNGSVLPDRFDPKQGDFWQSQVFALRSWWWNLPCSDHLDPSP